MAAQVLWHEWFPSIWLDEHQQGPAGPRIFTMPATDPINPNVDPLIYRLNGFFGQSQAAALEAEGKTGIIFNSTYTNFWQGAMAWAGWWHNQVGLLTEVASARIATPVVQQMADGARGGAATPRDRRPGGGHRTGERADGVRGRTAPRLRASQRSPAPAPRHHAAHGVSASLAGRQMDPARHRRLRTDGHVRPARGGRRPARDAAAPNLRRQSQHHRGRQERRDRQRQGEDLRGPDSRRRRSTIRTRRSTWSTS